jgi:hypothetical protein
MSKGFGTACILGAVRTFPFEYLYLDSGFHRSDEHKKGIVFSVIPAEAGIQEGQK